MNNGVKLENGDLNLKVPSVQIGSALEWCYWIGLEKDIIRYRFLVFKFGF
jgi:hypothetical protein